MDFYIYLKDGQCQKQILQELEKNFSLRGLQPSNSRESPATLYTVEDEVEKTFNRKKSFFNKKASKSSILTVSLNNDIERQTYICKHFPG